MSDKNEIEKLVDFCNSKQKELKSAIEFSAKSKIKYYSEKLKVLAEDIIRVQNDAIKKLCSMDAIKGNIYFMLHDHLYSYNIRTSTTVRVDKDIDPVPEIPKGPKLRELKKATKDGDKRRKAILDDDVARAKKDLADANKIYQNSSTLSAKESVAEFTTNLASSEEALKKFEAEETEFKKLAKIPWRSKVEIPQDNVEEAAPQAPIFRSERSKRHSTAAKTQASNENAKKRKTLTMKKAEESEETRKRILRQLDDPIFDKDQNLLLWEKTQCANYANYKSVISANGGQPDFRDMEFPEYDHAVQEREKVKRLVLYARQKLEDKMCVSKVLDALKRVDREMKGEARDNIRETISKIVKSFINFPNQFENKYLNIVLLGPPGSGKTTVANLMGNLYRHLGVLVSGNMSQQSRATLVGQYIGETAHKTRQALISNMEGVMFIDEAYAVAQSQSSGGGSDPFGVECLNEIVGFLDKNKGKICIIAAGYTNEMEKFFYKINTGLKRRFPYEWTLKNYSSNDLVAILDYNIHKIIGKGNLLSIMDDKGADFVMNMIQSVPDLFKSQAGDVENLATFLTEEYYGMPSREQLSMEKAKSLLRSFFHPIENNSRYNTFEKSAIKFAVEKNTEHQERLEVPNPMVSLNSAEPIVDSMSIEEVEDSDEDVDLTATRLDNSFLQ